MLNYAGSCARLSVLETTFIISFIIIECKLPLQVGRCKWYNITVPSEKSRSFHRAGCQFELKFVVSVYTVEHCVHRNTRQGHFTSRGEVFGYNYLMVFGAPYNSMELFTSYYILADIMLSWGLEPWYCTLINMTIVLHNSRHWIRMLTDFYYPPRPFRTHEWNHY